MSSILKNILEKYFYNKESFFIQVGACDGISYDDYRVHVLNNELWKCVLVEPVPHIFEKLKYNYKIRKNIYFENSVISNNDGKIKFNVVDEKYLLSKGRPAWAIGISSIYKDKNSLKNKEISSHIVELELSCITIKTLIKKYQIEWIDQLQIDAEGYDNVIIQNIIENKIFPKLIRFEHNVITKEERINTNNLLEENDYFLILDGRNTIALRV